MSVDAIRVGRYLIYGLIDPRDRCLRYVGKTHKRRETRLREHLEAARLGSEAPVAVWIRELLAVERRPEIFVLKRVESTEDWRASERAAISTWRAWPASELPYIHLPQTRKSVPVLIEAVALLNVREGG